MCTVQSQVAVHTLCKAKWQYTLCTKPSGSTHSVQSQVAVHTLYKAKWQYTLCAKPSGSIYSVQSQVAVHTLYKPSGSTHCTKPSGSTHSVQSQVAVHTVQSQVAVHTLYKAKWRYTLCAACVAVLPVQSCSSCAGTQVFYLPVNITDVTHIVLYNTVITCYSNSTTGYPRNHFRCLFLLELCLQLTCLPEHTANEL